MTLAELLTIRNSLPKNASVGEISTRYKMAKLIRATAGDFDFYVEQYKAILLSCAKHGHDGSVVSGEGGIPVDPAKAEEFATRVKELDATEAACPDIRFTLEELEPFSLSVEVIMALDPIIKE